MEKCINSSNLRHDFHLYGGKSLRRFNDFLTGYEMGLVYCEIRISLCVGSSKFNKWFRERFFEEAKNMDGYMLAKKYFYGEEDAIEEYFRLCDKTETSRIRALKNKDLLKARIGKWFKKRIESSLTCINEFSIASIYFGNEEEAFDRYFEWYDEYWSQHQDEIVESSKVKVENIKPNFKLCWQSFQERPAMFLRRKAITNIYAYWQGYFQVYKDFNVELGPDEQHLLSYFDWIKKQLEPGQTNRTWAEVLLSAEGDEQKAGGRFFELYDEFTALKEQEKQDKAGIK